jgi:hypothetical protein
MAIPNQTCVAGRAVLRWWEAGRAFPLFVEVNVYRTPFVATDGEGGHVAPVEQQRPYNRFPMGYQYNKCRICGLPVEDYVLDKSTREIYKAFIEGRHFHFLPSSEREARMDDPRGQTPSSERNFLVRHALLAQSAMMDGTLAEFHSSPAYHHS